jgi:ketosteroid isomerase-like protein
MTTPVVPIEGELWDVSRAFWRIPELPATTVEDRIAALETDRELRDVLARYIDALDSGDLAAIMRFIHDDCVIVGPRGTLVGTDQIRRDYAFVLANSTARVHRATNVVVRVVAHDEAWIASRNTAILRRLDGSLIAVVAVVVDRLLKEGEWRMRERRVEPIVSYAPDQQPFTLAPAADDEVGGRSDL